MPRAKRAHVQPNSRRSRAAVECKRQRALRRFLAIERVGDKEHFGFDFSMTALDRKPPRCCRVLQSHAIHLDLVMSHNWRHFGHVVVLFFLVVTGLGFRLGRSGLRRLGSLLFGLRWRLRLFSRLFRLLILRLRLLGRGCLLLLRNGGYRQRGRKNHDKQ